MTSTETLAIVLYAVGAALAISGPLIAMVRIMRKRRETASELTGTWSDPAIDPDVIRATASSDVRWGTVEFALVAAGVVVSSVASIILIIN